MHQLGLQGRTKARKRRAQRRNNLNKIVDHELLSKLVQDYWRHFNNYNKGRKKATKQLIPKKVWALVFKDYFVHFPTSSFKEDSFKDHM